MPFNPRSKPGKRDMRNQQKRRGGAGPRDRDDDVDARGNVRGLIDYDYESDSNESEVSISPSEFRALKKYGKLPKKVKEDLGGRIKPRKAALKARERIRRKLRQTRSSSDTSDSSYKPSRRTKDEEEEEDDSETLGSEDTRTDEEEEEEEEVPVKKSKGKSRRQVVESESEEEEEEDEEEDDEEDEEEEEEDDEDYDEDEEEEEDAKEGFQGLSIIFGGGGETMRPQRHNMKKQPESVKRFVKLLSNPQEENTIDDQIDQFKTLDAEKQRTLLEALERRSDHVKKEQPLMFRLLQMKLAPETMALVMSRYNALNTMDPSSGEYYKLRAWMEKIVNMPLGIYKEMPVRIEDGAEACAPFMDKARRFLDDAIYGQDEAKLQIQQFIASKIANPSASGLSLLLIGPPGIGKTSLIKGGIAKALNWPFQFISLGGDSDATTYTGHQFVYEGSHCGKIANCLAQAKSMSMVLMFDELDKVSTTAKGEEIQNLLVHLTDPVQNMEFEDKYLSGIPLDLSRTMFVFSANDISKIDRILLDRMVVVQLQGYEKKDKLEIAEKYLLPEALREVNLAEKVAWSREVLQHILENYASEETGVRELKRCIGQIAQRINMLRMFNVKELPFHIPGFQLPFVLRKEHVDLFLKKKEMKEKVPFGMYA